MTDEEIEDKCYGYIDYIENDIMNDYGGGRITNLYNFGIEIRDELLNECKSVLDKMKNCYNCKYHNYDRFDIDYCKLKDKKIVCRNKDKWRIKE